MSLPASLEASGLRLTRLVAAAVVGAIVGGGLTVPARADPAGDPVAGKAIAERWCAGCHLIDGAVETSDAAIPLAALARRPHYDANALAAFLTVPHGGMPDLSLTQREIADLIAFIETLR
ncbi:MAG: c-type cytochrome [Defluviicoccus sp.]|nr:c-type cytochrome [Defluviicoccus sp.]